VIGKVCQKYYYHIARGHEKAGGILDILSAATNRPYLPNVKRQELVDLLMTLSEELSIDEALRVIHTRRDELDKAFLTRSK